MSIETRLRRYFTDKATTLEIAGLPMSATPPPMRRTRVGRLSLAAGAALVLIGLPLLTVWWMNSPNDETVYGSFSAPSYESVEALAADSDLIVDGVVVGVAGRELDYGTANPNERVGESGVPIVFYEVAVLETLKGQTESTIIVGKIDAENLVSASITPLEAGDQVLLFLVEQVSENDSPGITLFDFYYTTLSLDAGVFDVLPDGTIKPRAPELRSTTGSSVFERAELEAQIAGE